MRIARWSRTVAGACGRILVGMLALSACPHFGPSVLFAQCPDGTPPPCAGAHPPTPVIVVEPFENRSRDTADIYLAATFTEDLTSALLASHRVRLRNPRASHAAADFAVAGSVRRTGTVVRIAARLQRESTGEIVWTQSLDRNLSRLGAAALELAHDVLGRTGAGTAVTSSDRPVVDAAAYDLYLRGRYHAIRRSETEIGQAVDLFRQAVARDSTFALAWAGLANALYLAARWHLPVRGISPDRLMSVELDAAERALLADSTNSETWVTRARVAEDVDPTSQVGARSAVRRALSLDSLNADAWGFLALLHAEAGDTAGASAAGRRAVAIDPGDLEAMTALSVHYYWARRYDSAAVWADSMTITDPTFLSGHRMAGTVALARGRLADAEAQFGAARTIGPGPERIWAIAGLACAAVARGDSAAARALVADAVSLTSAVGPALHSAVFVAWGYAALGEHEQALTWLERYRPRGDLHFQAHLRGDTPLDVLHGEPRFQALLTPRSGN